MCSLLLTNIIYYNHVSGLGSSWEHTTGEFIQNVLVSALGFEEDTEIIESLNGLNGNGP